MSVSQRDVINAQTPGRSGLVLYPGAVAGATSSRTMLFPAKTHARSRAASRAAARAPTTGRELLMATTSRRKVRRRMRPATHRAIAARLSPHHRAWWRVSRFIALPSRAHWRDEHPSSTTRTGLTIASPAPFDTIVFVCNRCWFTWIWQKFGSNFMFNWCVTDEHANEIWEEK